MQTIPTAARVQPRLPLPAGVAAPGSLLDDVRRGLMRRQKAIPPKHFYDQTGSELFEAITRLPEYYLTRAERRLLAAWMLPVMSSLRPTTLVELGAGNGDKTRLILRAMRLAGEGRRYVPVDLSGDFLEASAQQLRADFSWLDVVPVVGDFTRELAVPAQEGKSVIAFLGSTIGNLSTAESVALLRSVRSSMRCGDRFLLGADLRTKPMEKILRAYNDRSGITARFNRNILVRLNRELGTDFDVAAFDHRATWSEAHKAVEMHLVSTRDQRVVIPGLGSIPIRRGETIHTETCAKFDRPDIEGMLAAAGMTIERWLLDLDDRYALVLAAPDPAA